MDAGLLDFDPAQDAPRRSMERLVMPVVDAASLRRYKKEFNFFETPELLANRMAELVDDVGLNAWILEPSAGLGALIRATAKAIKYEIRPIDFCEVQEEFASILTQSGAVRVGSDFLQYHPGPSYDAIIMNPPYKNGMAERHVDHAWNCIRPGGKIVALVGMKAVEWIDDEFLGHVFEREEIEKGAFAETNVKTCLYLIHKPMDGHNSVINEPVSD